MFPPFLRTDYIYWECSWGVHGVYFGWTNKKKTSPIIRWDPSCYRVFPPNQSSALVIIFCLWKSHTLLSSGFMALSSFIIFYTKGTLFRVSKDDKKAKPNAHISLLDFPTDPAGKILIVFVYNVHPAKCGFMVPAKTYQTAIWQFWKIMAFVAGKNVNLQ